MLNYLCIIRFNIFVIICIVITISLSDSHINHKIESCNAIISDDNIQRYKTSCLRGQIEWSSTNIDLVFAPYELSDNLKNYRICLYVVSKSRPVTISHTHSGQKLTIDNTISKEMCIEGTSYEEIISLSQSTSGNVKVEFLVDTTAPCKDKCSPNEIVEIVCSSRFVISGIIEEIKDNKLKIKVSASYRDTDDFVKDGIAYLYIKQCKEHIQLNLNTRYMFIGDTRLSLYTLTCAVSINNFVSLWKEAVSIGSNTCYL